IRSMNEWTQDLSRGQGNDMHGTASGSFFTCQPLTPNSNDPWQGVNVRYSPKPIGPSLDHVIARQLSPEAQPLLVRVVNVSDDGHSAISFSDSETPYPGIASVKQLWSGLTGLFEGDDAAPLSPDSYQAIRGKSIIDLVADDLDTLARFDLSQHDRLKLEAWKELLHETSSVVTAQCGADAAASLGLTQAGIDALPTPGLGRDPLTTKLAGELDGADVFSNLAVLAAACNANPVIFLKFPPNYVFSGLGLDVESHGVSHRIGNAGLSGNCLPDALERIATIDRYYARKFAHLVATLDGISEEGGTLLDGTAAVWFQEVADGLAHNHNNLPIVQAGSAGGYFKTGWSINVEDGSAELPPGNSEFYCTEPEQTNIGNLLGVTGTDPALGNAPINKYFCNLMNALGVKAGEDGFPLEGGAAEVTRFGRYDKTEDFVGGDINPPIIHSPGGFDALKVNG
ncbi:MAG: DUF1552 domain-containing protein, partial [Myxococcota bacterium]|nr:DUF1552 domain-containing protein [Myxococcota bacterium]